MTIVRLGKEFVSRVSLAFAVVGVILAGCGQPQARSYVPTPARQPSRNDPAIWKYIDDDIPAKDKPIVYDELAAIPSRGRRNVIFYENGRVYSNHLNLLRHARFDRAIRTSRPKALGPHDDLDCNPNGGWTGVLHKMCSTEGFNYFRATVTLPCATTYLQSRANASLPYNPVTTGYIYSGGNAGAGQGEVDAGLQINPPLSGMGPPNDVQGYMTSNLGSLSGSISLSCDSTVTFEFFPAQYDATSPVRLTLLIDPWGSMSVTLPANNSYGWSQYCPSCVVKRVTSLAIAPSHNGISPGISPGTYFGVLTPTTQPTPEISWRNVVQGYYTGYGPDNSPVTQSWLSCDINTCVDDPSDGESDGLVIALQYDSANEDVGINETQPFLINSRPHVKH